MGLIVFVIVWAGSLAACGVAIWRNRGRLNRLEGMLFRLGPRQPRRSLTISTRHIETDSAQVWWWIVFVVDLIMGSLALAIMLPTG